MARKSIKTTVLKALLAKSGNVCAFPRCQQELVTKKNLFVGELCHIEAVSPSGPRYNPASTDNQRNGFENLMFLCHPHHREIDAYEGTYPVSWLKQVKSEHEACYEGREFTVNREVISQIERESHMFWSGLVRMQDAWLRQGNIIPELAVKIDADIFPAILFKDIRDTVQHIESALDILREDDHGLNDEVREYIASLGYSLNRYDSASVGKNPFINRMWEIHNLLLRNSALNLRILLLQAEVRYLEEYSKTHSDDMTAQKRLEAVKRELAEHALAAPAD